VTERKKNSPVDYLALLSSASPRVSEGARRREGQLMKSFVHNRVRDRGKHRVQPKARPEGHEAGKPRARRETPKEADS
jgi:hypothetical protein